MKIETRYTEGRLQCDECSFFPCEPVFIVQAAHLQNTFYLCEKCLKKLREQLNPLTLLIITGENTK